MNNEDKEEILIRIQLIPEFNPILDDNYYRYHLDIIYTHHYILTISYLLP